MMCDRENFAATKKPRLEAEAAAATALYRGS